MWDPNRYQVTCQLYQLQVVHPWPMPTLLASPAKELSDGPLAELPGTRLNPLTTKAAFARLILLGEYPQVLAPGPPRGAAQELWTAGMAPGLELCRGMLGASRRRRGWRCRFGCMNKLSMMLFCFRRPTGGSPVHGVSHGTTFSIVVRLITDFRAV